MHMLLSAAVVSTTGFSSFALISALWGLGSSWLAEVIKQDHWPKPVNAIIADLMLIVSAALATLTVTTFTWQHLGSAVLAVSVAALINHQFVLKGTGVGDWLQSITTFNSQQAAVPVDPNAQLVEVLTQLAGVLGRPVQITQVVAPAAPAEDAPSA